MVQKKKENGKRTLRKVRLARLLHGNALTPQILIIVSESQSSHFIGRFGDEATLFRLAVPLEAARPWAGHRPPTD